MRLRITFYSNELVNPSDRFSTHKIIDTITVSAKKMSNKEMVRYFGKDWKDYHNAAYYCTPRCVRQYGITWILEDKSWRDGSNHVEVVVVPKETTKTPAPTHYGYVSVSYIQVRNNYCF